MFTSLASVPSTVIGLWLELRVWSGVIREKLVALPD